ncbi:MAG: hypothetical protein CMH52_00545 [Myxococcales bacterium]|nr:hypothetical protein [Myxococcales bacterium]
MRLAAIGLVACFAFTAHAQNQEQQDREASLFGDASEPTTETPRSSDRDRSIFGAPNDKQLSNAPVAENRLESTLVEKQDPLAIGGRLYLRTGSRYFDDSSLGDMPLNHSAQLFVYGDARPTNRLRAFVRTRFDHDFIEQRVPANQTALGTSGSNEQTRAQLDQLWLKFDVDRKAYVTIGQQPIRWGSARIWNPTDFVNAQRLDPLAIFDIRPGIPMFKVHVPIESSGTNLYAIAQVDGAERLSETGGVIRAEQTLPQSELSATMSVRKDQPLRLGLDYSVGIDVFELRFEGAAIRGGDVHRWTGTFNPDLENLTIPERVDLDWAFQSTIGLEWTIGYGDQESAYWTIEYFHNELGYSDAELYPWLALTGELNPLYLGRHYLATNIILPRPGSFNDLTVLSSGIWNLSDNTGIVRVDLQVQVLTRLSVFMYASTYLGDQGEFRFAFDLPADPAVPGLEDGIEIKSPIADIGFWLSVAL